MELKHLKMAVCGQTTPGKRLICNGLLGKEIIPEGDWGLDNTSCVNSNTYEATDRNMEITICDVHGFDDSLMNVAADQYISEIKGHCVDADLLLYCIELKEAGHRFESDRETLIQLKKCFDSSSVWDHCIFALIFPHPILFKGEDKRSSNHVQDNKEDIAYWTRKFKEALESIGISNKAKILPAGDAVAFSLLNNNKYWLSDLYAMAKGLVGDIQRDVFVQLNMHRCIIKSEIKINSFDDDITRQPIVVSDGSKELLKDIATGGATAVGVGTATGTVRAGICATIGALSIGIPTFGVAAGAGMVLGGAIGGLVGVAAGGKTTGILLRLKQMGRNCGSQ